MQFLKSSSRKRYLKERQALYGGESEFNFSIDVRMSSILLDEWEEKRSLKEKFRLQNTNQSPNISTNIFALSQKNAVLRSKKTAVLRPCSWIVIWINGHTEISLANHPWL